MLTIRKEQVKVFKEQKLQDFIDEMTRHIQEFTPQQFKITGEANIRKVIKLGILRAENYGFTYRGPVQFYIELMFMLGSDFDTDPQYNWISEILKSDNNVDQMERADYLHEKVLDYVNKVIGPKNKYEIDALLKFTKLQFEDFKKLNSENPHEILEQLKKIYPEKANLVGESCLLKLHSQSVATARMNGNSDNGGIAVSFFLMFAFGHGCFTDLQYSWLSSIRKNSSVLFPNDINQKLFTKMMIYFEKALNSIDHN
jgi:hypothetical protein